MKIRFKNNIIYIDKKDLKFFNSRKWHLFLNRTNGAKYLRGWDVKRKKKIFFHREIIKANNNQQVDHINGNSLDNRKSNLRKCSLRQNILNRKKPKNNTSGYKGVFKIKNRWKALIGVNKKRIYLGCFLNKKDAAKAYNDAAIKYFGKFSNINKL